MPPGTSTRLWEGRFWGGTDQRIIGYGEVREVRIPLAFPGTARKPFPTWTDYEAQYIQMLNHVATVLHSTSTGASGLGAAPLGLLPYPWHTLT